MQRAQPTVDIHETVARTGGGQGTVSVGELQCGKRRETESTNIPVLDYKCNNQKGLKGKFQKHAIGYLVIGLIFASTKEI